VVELTHSDLNYRFGMCVVFMANYFLVRDNVPVDSDTLLVTDFMNLKIKSIQSFRCVHRGKMYVHMLIGVSVHTYMSICIYTVFLKEMITNTMSYACI
jgi:hypothetical protein